MKYFLNFGAHKFEGLEEFITILGLDKSFIVYCYEPNKSIYDLSMENGDVIKKYEDLFYAFKHHNLAVMNYTGEIIFNSHNGAWSSDKNNYFHNYTYCSNCLDINPLCETVDGVVFDVVKIICKCIDIEEILASIVKNDDDAMIYIKCDIEGSEFCVLPRLLQSEYIDKIKFIDIEWHEKFWYGTDEYENKVYQKIHIHEKLCNLNIKTCINNL